MQVLDSFRKEHIKKGKHIDDKDGVDSDSSDDEPISMKKVAPRAVDVKITAAAVDVSQKAVTKAVDVKKLVAKVVDVSHKSVASAAVASAVLKTMNENEMDLRDIDLCLDQATAEELKFSRQGKEMQAKEQKEIADKWRKVRNERKKMLNDHKFSAQPQIGNKARSSAEGPSPSHDKLSHEPTAVCGNLQTTVQNEVEENDHADVFGTLESFDDMFGEPDSPDEVAPVKDDSSNQSNLNRGDLTHELIMPDSPDLVVMEVIEARCKYCQRPQSDFKSLNSFGSHKSVCKKKHKDPHDKETHKPKVKKERSDVKSTTNLKAKRTADDDVAKNFTLSKKNKPDVIVSKSKGYAAAVPLSERQQVHTKGDCDCICSIEGCIAGGTGYELI